MVKSLFVVGACIALVCLGFSAVIFGLPFTLLLSVVLLGVALLAWIVVKALQSLS